MHRKLTLLATCLWACGVFALLDKKGTLKPGSKAPTLHPTRPHTHTTHNTPRLLRLSKIVRFKDLFVELFLYRRPRDTLHRNIACFAISSEDGAIQAVVIRRLENSSLVLGKPIQHFGRPTVLGRWASLNVDVMTRII